MRYLALTALLLAGPALAAPPAPSGAEQTEPTFDELRQQALHAMGQRDRERAIDLLQQALALRPDSKLPVQRLCAIYKAMSQPEQAIGHCLAWRERERDAVTLALIDKTILDMRDRIRAKAAD